MKGLWLRNGCVALKKLSELVGRLNLTDHGVALIVDADGNLIASFTEEPLFRFDGSIKRRALAAESTSEVVRATYFQFAATLTAAAKNELPRTTRFMASGAVITVAVDYVRDHVGLNGFTMAAGPQSDFIAALSSSLARAIVVGLLAAGIAMLLGLWMLN